ncbi:hypothetical protein [Cellulomonas terrae]|nr:hypothetical protein [Cellulomonas terrae]
MTPDRLGPQGPSRRAVLTGAVSGIGTALLAAPTKAAASERAAGGTAVALVPLETSEIVTYDSTWATQHVLDVPLAVSIAGYALPSSGLTVTVSFDLRLLASTDRVAIAAGTASWSASCEPAQVLDDGTARVTFDVVRPQGSSRRRSSSTVALPLRPLDLYPDENIGAPHPLVIEVVRRGGAQRTARTWSTVSRSVPATPWGVEVAAAWTSLELPGSLGPLGYRAPISVRLRSTGPAPIPAGSELVVDLDASVVAGLEVLTASIDGLAIAAPTPRVGRQDETLLRGSWVVPVAIPAGSVLDVVLDCTPVAAPPTPRSLRRATVSLVGAGAGVPRETGRYTAVDLTSSGTPTTDGIAVGTI